MLLRCPNPECGWVYAAESGKASCGGCGCLLTEYYEYEEVML